MARNFCIPGIVILFCAFVLSFITSISLPFLTGVDIVRTQTGNGFLISGQGDDRQSELRFGVWAPCFYDPDQTRTCYKAEHGYVVALQNTDKSAGVIIGSSWTRGLAVHPVATVVTFVAFLLSFSQHITLTLAASLMSFLAATITLIAFAIDIALFAFLKHQVKKLPKSEFTTKTSAGFWMTFVTLILLIVAGCTVCFGRRKDRLSGATPSYPKSTKPKKSIWSKFRKN